MKNGVDSSSAFVQLKTIKTNKVKMKRKNVESKAAGREEAAIEGQLHTMLLRCTQATNWGQCAVKLYVAHLML